MTVVRARLAPEFVEYPDRIPREIYDRAATAYARLVSGRTHAVYRTGSVTVPGISDLDLIVVPMAPRYDDYAYFSTARLPQPLRQPFRHGPFVVPFDAQAILRYSSHRAPVLLSGDDVLARVPAAAAPEDRWSMVLEDYCHYSRYFRQVRREGRAEVRFVLSKVESIRIPALRLHELTGGRPGPTPAPGAALGPELGSLLERGRAIRNAWFDHDGDGKSGRAGGATARARAADAWDVLSGTFDMLEELLRQALGQPAGADLVALAHAFLRGDPVVPDTDPALVRSRQEEVLAYHRSINRFAISGLPVVHCPLHGDELRRTRRPRPPRPVRAVVRLRYRLDRAIRTLFQM
jgi:hypothetical protein